ncbi:hypothetical protein E5F05_06900 [Deinococcus metallilatus]|uniref:Uncharacterized protein n=1 Tax=Deinococcus metallilatus TaxID=1211322 RepID=A0AAJ5F4V8_9DEIO|nr:hypothetical protein [Deinococcus metallilatus]MBB5294674.1 hypothetical protein [Deinococcus metallilatus]QBY07709.1 hypothetical protein E5F05_06900 [Deinococcus metallilatus]RXJ14125.1 hypothetical protein ERJ73_05735 [Deinococcus metallilatus]TLK30090.1 hypothetical protein FCS05_06050 [Deinococcus metallilatus]GMA15891.1 hypothetical protein GCM10025871_22220 [Deinococcus metallilatus]
MSAITEVLPDVHGQLWVTLGDRTLHVQFHPLRGGQGMMLLDLRHVFQRVRVTDNGMALTWPGGFTLPLCTLDSRRDTPWLTHLGVVPVAERYRPLLPLLRHATPGAPLRAQPTRLHVIQMFGMREGELDSVLRAYPVSEQVMLHRLHDLGLFLKHHLFPELPVALLRRPWAYAAHRVPQQHHLHTLQACLTWGRLDLVEDPLWALARAEVAG